MALVFTDQMLTLYELWLTGGTRHTESLIKRKRVGGGQVGGTGPSRIAGTSVCSEVRHTWTPEEVTSPDWGLPPGLSAEKTEDLARKMMQRIYGPLLDPIRKLIMSLDLSPGDEIISVAIRDIDGEIRVKSV